MTAYLNGMLQILRDHILWQGFKQEVDEIKFFREIKPHVLGRLLHYNKVFRIETACLAKEGKVYQKFLWASYRT